MTTLGSGEREAVAAGAVAGSKRARSSKQPKLNGLNRLNGLNEKKAFGMEFEGSMGDEAEFCIGVLKKVFGG